MATRLNIPEKLLKDLYVKEGLSTRAIAKRLGCWNTTIAGHLKNYGIPLRQPKLPLRPDKNYLQEEYLRKQRSPYMIAEDLNCDPKTVRLWLIRYGFPIRKKKRIQISPDELRKLYVTQRMSLSQIAKKLDCVPAGILKLCRRFGIKPRTISESSKFYLLRKDFDGTPGEKAYLIGFRLGDLHIRRRGYVIGVGGGTTKKDQVILFKNLFKRYGNVYIGNQDKRSAWHPAVNLNNSFDFLLPKHKTIPNWIMTKRQTFLSFLAGYTDAEGNIGCYPRARLKIASYDYALLKGLRRGIKKFFHIDSRLWMEKTDRRTHNKDTLSLIINSAEPLFRLLNILGPKLRHRKRKQDYLRTIKTLYPRLHIRE